MGLFLRRLSIVCLFGMGTLLLLEAALSRDETVETCLALTATGTDAAGEPVAWMLEVSELGGVRLNGRGATLDQFLADLESAGGEITLKTLGDDLGTSWEAVVAPGGVTLNGAAATKIDLAGILYQTAVPRTGAYTEAVKAVTVADVLAAAKAGKILMPTRSKVSLPGFSYKEAFPDATDEPEIVIEKYSQSPWLENLDLCPEPEWRKHYPDSLPPVAERLPRNPGVVIGPDGIGQYGGVWRECHDGSGYPLVKTAAESFVRFDPAGRIQPALAYKWDISDSNRVYTFYLRKGHKWSDGEPFTTEDILWVCNTVIGSASWASSPNWMMETDGTALLYVDDILDWPGLREKILADAAAEAPSAAKQLALIGEEAFLAMIRKIPESGEPSENLQYEAVEAINRILCAPGFFGADSLGAVDFDAELEALHMRGFSTLDKETTRRAIMLMDRKDLFRRASENPEDLAQVELSRLNLMLFRANYAGLVEIARIKRVKIEAVADEDGDTSHIIRFTFPKPNSIFLEKTATRMCYLGMFDTPKHTTRLHHPAGMKELARSDILAWDKLFRTLRRQADQPGESPGKRLWAMLDEATKDGIVAAARLSESSRAAKQQIVDALNRVMTRRDFYDEAAWDGTDWDAAYSEKVADGFSHLMRDRGGRNLAMQMLVRGDLLRRVHDRGVSDLTDAELLDFNVFVFRAAYDRIAGEPLVAINREDGLNVTAQHHPKRYDTWTSRYRKQGYDAELNPHLPTLRTWRLVTDVIEQRQVYIRNAYYYKVDAEGNQLPYIDSWELDKQTNPPNIIMSLASASVDFQCRKITWEHFSYLKAKAGKGDKKLYDILVWANDYVGEMNFFPLQAQKDPVLRALYSDRRFRHALSMAINRQEVIDIVFSGLGTPAGLSVPKGSPYYNESMATFGIAYDPDEANRILDEMGLAERGADGVRKLSDGRPLVVNVECAEGDFPLQAVELVCAYWNRIGINARMKVSNRGLINRKLALGIFDIGVAREGGNFNAPLQAGAFAPTHPAESPQWSQWVAYFRSGGRKGWEPPDWLRDIDRKWETLINAPNDEAKFAAWEVLAEQTALDMPRIGLMTSPGKLVYVKKGFKNVPKLAIAGWITHEPTNCCPEVFYIEQER